MVLKSKFKDPTVNFVIHGVKTVGNYVYVLLVDMTGQALIRRIKNDNTEILFSKKPDQASISDFWTNADQHTYQYIHEV